MICKTIYLFAGTTEGRQISEYLSKCNLEHHVFVATEYGARELETLNKACIHVGRIDIEEMAELFRKDSPDLVIDATHSYATIVSQNIRKALEMCDMTKAYLRIKRSMVELANFNSSLIIKARDTEDAINKVNDLLKEKKGNVLLTTGVKTIEEYVKGIKNVNKIYARILPSVESLNIAYEAGLEAGGIIAMEGPFNEEINKALISQYNISCLVTKNSGKTGGVIEKITACLDREIPIIIIDNPDNEMGFSLDEAISFLDDMNLSGEENVVNYNNDNKKFTIIGIGMGDRKSITLEAAHRIKAADVVIGAKRMLEVAKQYNNSASFEMAYLPSDVLDIYKSSLKEKIAFLVSGDSGFYSGTKKVVDIFSQNGIDVEILPGISSVSYLAAVTGRPYSDSLILSCHGKSSEEISRILANDFEVEFLKKNQAYIICSGLSDAKEIIETIKRTSEKLDDSGRISIVAGYNMGQEDEAYYSDVNQLNKDGLYIIGVFRKVK